MTEKERIKNYLETEGKEILEELPKGKHKYDDRNLKTTDDYFRENIKYILHDIKLLEINEDIKNKLLYDLIEVYYTFKYSFKD